MSGRLFKSKPVVVIAWRWGQDAIPNRILKKIEKGHGNFSVLKSGENEMVFSGGDWFVQGPEKEDVYVVKHDVFVQKYGEVENVEDVLTDPGTKICSYHQQLPVREQTEPDADGSATEHLPDAVGDGGGEGERPTPDGAARDGGDSVGENRVS